MITYGSLVGSCCVLGSSVYPFQARDGRRLYLHWLVCVMARVVASYIIFPRKTVQLVFLGWKIAVLCFSVNFFVDSDWV